MKRSPATSFLRVLLPVAAIAALAPSALAQDLGSQQAIRNHIEELLRRDSSLTQELAYVQAAETQYLIALDQVLNMRLIVDGNPTPDQNYANLVSTRQYLYHNSFTAQQWANLFADHRGTAQRYWTFAYNAVNGDANWPNTATPETWHAEAYRQLSAASQAYDSKLAQGADVTAELRTVEQVILWTRGYPSLPAEYDHFAGTAQRVAAAMAQ